MRRELVTAVAALAIGGLLTQYLPAQDRSRTGGETGENEDEARVLSSTLRPEIDDTDGPPSSRARRISGRPPGEPTTDLNDFTGTWTGNAVDYPEDGSSTRAIGIKIELCEDGELEGVGFDEFTGDDKTPLKDVYATGNRLEFKVAHCTGVTIRVTLGLVDGKLDGEGIPIRSDEDRCTITLKRGKKADAPEDADDDSDEEGFEGRWVGTVEDRQQQGDSRSPWIVDVSVSKDGKTADVITMGDFQQAYDDHFDEVKIDDGKLAFEIVDNGGTEVTVTLWLRGDKDDCLQGQVVADPTTKVRDVRLSRSDDRREDRSGDLRRLILDGDQPLSKRSYAPMIRGSVLLSRPRKDR